MKPFFRFSAIAVLSAIGAAAQSPPAKRAAPAPRAAAAPVPSYKDLKFPPLRPIPIPNVEIYTLPNGMRVFLLEDHELPVINGEARVRTGNLFDPPDKIGLATITGMVMRTGGTASKTGDQLDLLLEDIAAHVESDIGESSGSVSFSALKENADPVLAIFHDVLTRPEFRQERVDLAKSQMRSGISRRNDDAQGILSREFASIVYGKNSPYGWDEQYATIDNIKRSDLQDFYKRYFFPKNILFAVWGDFNSAGMKAKLEALFADWTVEQPPVPPFPKVEQTAAPGTYLAVKKDVTQTFFSIGQLGGELKDKDYPALEIMADILGGGFQSRLFQRVRTKMGNAYDISADWGADYDHPGLFQISGSTKAVSTVETIRAIGEEVQRIRSGEVSEDELKTAKDTALNSLVFAFSTRTKTLGRLLNYEYYGYPKDFIQQYQKALSAVTRADVLRAAKEHLDPAKFTVVTVGNPEAFAQPLESLGSPVIPVDLTIPEGHDTSPDLAGAAEVRRIMQRVQQAVGGADKLATVTDFVQTGQFQLDAAAGGLLVRETDRWLAPNYFRQDSQVPTGKISAYTDGKTGWISTPQGSGPLTGAQLQQVQGDLFRVYFQLLLSDRVPGRRVRFVDESTVQITAAGAPNGDNGVRLKLDPATGLPKSVTYDSVHVTGPPLTVEDLYSDFRDVNGIKVPFKISISQGGQKFADVTVTDLRINTGVKLSDLEKRPESEKH